MHKAVLKDKWGDCYGVEVPHLTRFLRWGDDVFERVVGAEGLIYLQVSLDRLGEDRATEVRIYDTKRRIRYDEW